VRLKSLAYRDLAGGAERGESFDLDLSDDLCVVDSLCPSGRRWRHPAGRAATAGSLDVATAGCGYTRQALARLRMFMRFRRT
jgi:hypothetical protein